MKYVAFFVTLQQNISKRQDFENNNTYFSTFAACTECACPVTET